jgi:hypothetical protein
MHLGLNNVICAPYQFMGAPVTLLKFRMAPRLILVINVLWLQEEGAQIRLSESPFHARKGEPQNNSRRFEEQKYLLLLPGFEPRTLQPFACLPYIYFCNCGLFSDAVCNPFWALNVE